MMFIVNVEGAILRDNKWLIIRRSELEEHAAGELSLVGGKVDYGKPTYDILEKTVMREIFEEVGLEVKDQSHYVFSSSFLTDDGIHVINHVFLCEYSQGEAYIKSPEEVGEILWLTTEEILSNESAAPWLKESILRAEAIYEKNSLGVQSK